MINKEQDCVDPYKILPRLNRRRDIMDSQIGRLERHLNSNAKANYHQAVESFTILRGDLEFVENLLTEFRKRILPEKS